MSPQYDDSMPPPSPEDGPLRPAPPDPVGPLVEGRDYVIGEDGYLVFTAEYHLRRGYCCESGCRHCPYGFEPPPA